VNEQRGALYWPMTVVTTKEAKARLDELLTEAAKGEEVVIAGEDGATFKLVLTETPSKKRRLIGSAKGQIWMADDFDAPLEDFKEYME
jgi:antitoxin (DNA-binding transcriptional repressor) of toxin-antitoxin stability system